MLYKNTASQKIAVFAYTASTGAAKTGDAANITCYESIGFAAADQLDDVNPTELDATNMPGWYVFDLTQAETNGEVLIFAPKSATSGVVLDQLQVFTEASINQTGDSYARLGAPAGASVSADIANLPTVAEFEARTLPSADYTVVSDVTTAAGNAIADALLARDWTEITASVPDRSTLNALRFLRNKWSVSGTTMTVTKEDDLAKAWEASLTSSSSANPITGMTPA